MSNRKKEEKERANRRGCSRKGRQFGKETVSGR